VYRGVSVTEADECAEAYKNPACPYVTQININTCDMKDIKRALLGEDGTGLRGGIVYEISLLKSDNKTTRSWTDTLKPVAIAVASSVLTFVITYALANRW
jgi:hypothetical protein